MPRERRDPLDVSPGTVDQYRQDRPSLVCRDLEAWGMPASITARVLMARGVPKWFAARRDLIRLKAAWKVEVRRLNELLAPGGSLRRGTPGRAAVVARLRALEECRASVRAICHGPRWAAPDHDPGYWRLLDGPVGRSPEPLRR